MFISQVVYRQTGVLHTVDHKKFYTPRRCKCLFKKSFIVVVLLYLLSQFIVLCKRELYLSTSSGSIALLGQRFPCSENLLRIHPLIVRLNGSKTDTFKCENVLVVMYPNPFMADLNSLL